MTDAKETGKEGEEIAARFLKSKGYRILERNYRTRFGEIDIIARKKKNIVFVEVKTRTSDEFGSPSEAVNRKKLAKLTSVASQFIQENRFEGFSFEFEVVSITKQGNQWHCEIIPVD